jgi:hypothetical protein
MDWMSLMNQVAQTIYANPTTPHKPGHDPDNLVGGIEQQFADYAPRMTAGQGANAQDALGSLFGQVQRSIYNAPSAPQAPGNDPGNLIGSISGLFNSFSRNRGMGEVLPASQDPYGDPADQGTRGFSNIRPASQDPYGDPADQMGRASGNIRPASEDPYGDPADQMRRASGNIRPASEDPYGDPG